MHEELAISIFLVKNTLSACLIDDLTPSASFAGSKTPKNSVKIAKNRISKNRYTSSNRPIRGQKNKMLRIG